MPRSAPPDIIFERADPLPVILARGQHFGRRLSVAECLAEAERSGDIVVCGAGEGARQALPEVIGPPLTLTDGAAVDPRSAPCGASIADHCKSGIDVIGTLGGAVNVVRLLLDPGRNLGEGARIPERYRGANR